MNLRKQLKTFEAANNRYWMKRERLKEALKEHEAKPCPTSISHFVEPIVKELKKRFPDHHIEILGPFGLTNQVSIHLYDKNKKDNIENCLSVTFRQNGENIQIVDYSKDSGEYGPNSIGSMNGMNFRSIEIPEDADIDWLIENWIK